DGLWDVFVPSSTRSFLYLGQAGGGFVEASKAAGLQGIQGGTGVLFFDFENDGDQDLLVGHVGWRNSILSEGGGQSLRAYKNDGQGRFREVTKIMGLDKIRCAAFGLTALDANGDGFVDVYVSTYGRMEHEINDSWNEATNGEPDILLRNQSGSFFQDVTQASGLVERGWTYGAVAADFDGDGDQDIYAVTTFGSNHLWINRGDGVFDDRAKERGVALRGNSMGVSVGDPNEDGKLDLFLTCPSSNTGRRILKRFDADERTIAWGDLARMAGGNLILQGDGEGAFEVIEGAGGAGGAGWAWGHALADFDLDGHQDVYCVNGFVTGDIPRDT
ncbi:MAG: VCBS repeat-containing protein, partial [Planctomycetes bacterium]|nr:VCBS repeat-containing protein [Planctomycetota bacterium]